MASAVSDEDEDVILPSSPLNPYMREFESFESDNLTDSEELPIMKGKTFRNAFNIKDNLTACCSVLKHIFAENFKQYLSFIYNIFVPCLITFEYSELKYMLDLAKNSKILVPEDLTVLLSYESEDDSNAELKLSYTSVFQQCFQLFAFVLIFIIMRSITISKIVTNEDLLSVFSDRPYFICLSFQVVLLVISIVLYTSMIIISLFIIMNFIEMILSKLFFNSIKKKIHTTECIMVMMRKCVRLIQEAELIARGFTSASVPGIVERLELSTGLPIKSPQRQYPELRKCIFLWTKEMFMLYKSNTQKLIKNKQFGPVLDFSSQSFAMLDLKEFGSLLKYDIRFDLELKELLRLTDGLSVSSLKTVYLLFELQVSEFYKYLYLITSFLISDDSLFNCLKKISYFFNLNSSIKILEKEDADILKISCETYKYYKSIEAVSDAEEKTLITQNSDVCTLEIYVHNMSLHLKAALKRLTDLEEMFEIEKKSSAITNENCLNKVDKTMKEIKSEVDEYHDYFLRCNNEVQNILYGEKQSSTDAVCRDISNKQHEEHKPSVITSCDSDPIIEDEIYEAIVTKSAQEKEAASEDYSSENQKQNLEISGKLLHELKNVLTVKADEHRLREKRAMAKKLNLEETLSDSDISEKVNADSKSNSNDSEVESEERYSESSMSDTEISKDTVKNSEYKNSIDTDRETDEECSGFPSVMQNSFAASIAALALQRQKKLGIADELCFSDDNESDEEIIDK